MEEWTLLSTYARTRGITAQAVSQQIKRSTYQSLWDQGHIKKEQNRIYFDDTAISALDDGRPAKVVIERVQQSEEMDSLRHQNEELRQELLTVYRELSSLKDRQLQLTDQSRQIEDLTQKVDTLNTQVDTKEKEKTELEVRLSTVEESAKNLSDQLNSAEQEKTVLSDQLSEARNAITIAVRERTKSMADLQKEQERVAGMEQEMEELRIQLEAEKRKSWWQKLLGK